MMNPFKVIAAVTLASILALSANVSGAQEKQAVKSDFMLRIDGPVEVAATDTIGTLWVIGNDAIVRGTVRELLVINGTARVDGTVQGNMVLMNASGELGKTARVGKDMLLFRSTMSPVGPAQVGGSIHNEAGMSFGARALWFLWLSFTIAMVAAGIVLAYLAGEPLAGVADELRGNWRGTLLATVAVVVGLPFAAFMTFLTGVGFVLGLFIIFFIIPVLSIIGYLVAGVSLGRATMNVARGHPSNLFLSVALGVFMLQLLSVVPGIGVLVAFLASQIGAGALVNRAWGKGNTVTMRSRLIIQPV